MSRGAAGEREYRRGSRSNPITERKCGIVVVAEPAEDKEVGLVRYDGVGRWTLERFKFDWVGCTTSSWVGSAAAAATGVGVAII